MSIQINYNKNAPQKSMSNMVLFVDEKFNILPIKKYLKNLEFSFIRDLLKTSDLKQKILTFDISSKKKNSLSFSS